MRRIFRFLLPELAQTFAVMAVYAAIAAAGHRMFGSRTEMFRVYGCIFPALAMVMPALLGGIFGARLNLALQFGATRRACYWGFEVGLCLLEALLQALSAPVLAAFPDDAGFSPALSPSAFCLLALGGLGLGNLSLAVGQLAKGRMQMLLRVFCIVMLFFFLGGFGTAFLTDTGGTLPSAVPPALFGAVGAFWLASAYGFWYVMRRTSAR